MVSPCPQTLDFKNSKIAKEVCVRGSGFSETTVQTGL